MSSPRLQKGRYPLGQRLAESPHAVCSSLPTMRDVIAYEERDAETMAQIKSGYPRFVTHEFVEMARSFLVDEYQLVGKSVHLLSTAEVIPALSEFCGGKKIETIETDGLILAHFPFEPESDELAGKFLRHTGSGVYSRQAESFLRGRGMCTLSQEERYTGDNPAGAVKDEFIKATGEGNSQDLYLSSCGMNAVFAAFRAFDKIQKPTGRRIWIQLGWLYLDTIAILKSFTSSPDDYRFFNDVTDLSSLRKFCQEEGANIAGIVTETPTNPLIRTPNLIELHQICREHGIACVVDPTVSSAVSINTLQFSDLTVNSLTKYSGGAGDIMMGAVLLNPDSPFYSELQSLIPALINPPFEDDLRRMAVEIKDFSKLVKIINHNTLQLVNSLIEHPAVKKIYWAYAPETYEEYRKLEREPNSPGGLFSMEIDLPLEKFYDAFSMAKGPSFGINFTIICPYIYLVHYDLLQNQTGRNILKENGLSPELIRVSVGAEEPQEIIEAFSLALSSK